MFTMFSLFGSAHYTFYQKYNTQWVYIFAHCVFLNFPIMCIQHQMMINFINGLIDFCDIPSMYYVMFCAHCMCSIAFYQFVARNGSV